MSDRLLLRLQQLGAAPVALTRLRAVIQAGRPLPSQAVIVRPGAAATHLHVLEEGWTCSSRALRDGRRQTLAVGLPGDICDLEALALGSCSVQVSALTPCRVARLPLSALRLLREEEVSIAAALQCVAAADRLIADEWLVNLGRRSAAERIAHLICEWVVRLRTATASGVVEFALPMTQLDVADVVGLSAVHVNRSLQALRRELGLRVERGRVTVPSWTDLLAFADFDANYLEYVPSLNPLRRLSLQGERSTAAHA